MRLFQNSLQTKIADLKGRQILVVGLGESGLAMATWAHQQQAQVAFVDTRKNPPGVAALLAKAPDAEWRCKDQVIAESAIEACLASVDLILLSPGVPFDHELVCAAKARDIPVWSEVDCFSVAKKAVCPTSRVVAITGANGKTTTTALTAHALNEAGVSAIACGNISPSLLDAFMGCESSGNWPEVWVIELSSFQLEATNSLGFDTAIILNLSEDHLDRHYTMAGYATAKARIYENCVFPVWSRDDIWVDAYGLEKSNAQSIGNDEPVQPNDFGLKGDWIVCGSDALLRMNELQLLGRHNALNVQAAMALASHVLPSSKSLRDLLAGVKTFKSLPHRMTLVATIDEVRYVDDSKATNVGATLAAIDGLFDGRDGKLAVILGGEGKGQDFSPLTEPVRRAARAIGLIGKDADKIAQVIPDSVPTKQFLDLPSATRWLADQARPGDTVLLSPACASLDMFANYAERAQVFVGTVRALNSCQPVRDGRAA